MITMGEQEQLERPAKFTPDWPPKASQKPLPNIFTRCSDKFKKVTWPPEGDDEQNQIAPPPAGVQLLDDIPLNDDAWRPTGTYKLTPTVYAEEPDNFQPDIWPPPEPINTDERVIHDPSRPKRAVRDYTVFFKANEAPATKPSYSVPPGTLHVISQRGVLSYNNPDIGSGRPKEPGMYT